MEGSATQYTLEGKRRTISDDRSLAAFAVMAAISSTRSETPATHNVMGNNGELMMIHYAGVEMKQRQTVPIGTGELSDHPHTSEPKQACPTLSRPTLHWYL